MNSFASANTDKGLILSILNIFKYILSTARSKTYLALLFLTLGSFTEGLSLLFLLPVLQLMGKGAGAGHDQIRVSNDYIIDLLGRPLIIDLWQLLLGFLTVVTLSAIFSRFKSIFLTELLNDVVNRLRIDVFRSIVSARWHHILKLRKADLDHVMTGDMDRIQGLFMTLFLLIQNVIFTIAYTLIAFCISAPMTLVAFGMGLIFIFALRPIRRQAHRLGEKINEERQSQYRTVSEFLYGLKVAKSFNSENTYVLALQDNLKRVRDRIVHFARINSIGNMAFQLASTAGGCVFIYVSYSLYKIELSKIIILLLLLLRIAPRFTDLQGYFQEISMTMPIYKMLHRTLSDCQTSAEDINLGPAARELTLSSELKFEKVSFAYGANRVFSDLSLRVPARSLTAIIGPSGIGKSTIADLAMGLLVPDRGTLLVDGVPLDLQELRYWRAKVGYVPQESYLFSASILENLKLGNSAASAEDVRTALRQAAALSFVEKLPLGADTLVGDGGMTLSGGERQRLALARALLKRPTLLVLDEVTSALDHDTADSVIRTVIELRKLTTIIMITHDPKVAHQADQIIDLSLS